MAKGKSITKTDTEGIQVSYEISEVEVMDLINTKIKEYENKYLGWDKIFIKPGQQIEDILEEGEYGYLINTLTGSSANLPRVDALIINMCNDSFQQDSNNFTCGLLNGRTVDIKLRQGDNVNSTIGHSSVSINDNNLGIYTAGSTKEWFIGKNKKNVNFLLNDPVVTENYCFTISMEVCYRESLINQGSDLLYISEDSQFNTDTSTGPNSYRTRDLRLNIASISGSQGSFSVTGTGGSDITSNVRFNYNNYVKVILACKGSNIDLYVNGIKTSITNATKPLRPKIIGLSRNVNNGQHINLSFKSFRLWNVYLDEIDVGTI